MVFEKEKTEAFLASAAYDSKVLIKGDFYTNCICFCCGKRKASVHVKDPNIMYCWSSSCEANKHNGGLDLVKHLGLELDYAKKYPSTKANPTRSIDSWIINERNIPRDLLEGLKRKQISKVRGSNYIAACFYVGTGADGKEAWTGRVIGASSAFGKSHGWGKFRGLYGTHPGKKIDYEKEVIAVEGPLDCYSLWAFGLQSIFFVSANADFKKIDLHRFKNLSFLPDHDPAGISCLKRALKNYPQAKALLLSPGVDPNDLLVKHGPEAGAKYFQYHREEHEFNAAFALSPSPQKSAELYFEFHKKPAGLFTFGNSTWFSEIRVRGENPVPKTERIGLFTYDALSHINTGTEIRKEYLYQVRIKPTKGRAIDCVASPKSLSSVKDFNTFLLGAARCNFEGKANALSALATHITTAKVPEVRQAEHVGFDTVSKAYIFNNHMIDKKGTLHFKDKNGLFKLGANERITPAAHAAEKAIEPSKAPKVSPKQVYEFFHKAWGYNGATAFAYAVSSAFCNQIKDKIGFFPYLARVS